MVVVLSLKIVIPLSSLISQAVEDLASLGGLIEGFDKRISGIDSKVLVKASRQNSKKAFYKRFIITSSLLYQASSQKIYSSTRSTSSNEVRQQLLQLILDIVSRRRYLGRITGQLVLLYTITKQNELSIRQIYRDIASIAGTGSNKKSRLSSKIVQYTRITIQL